MKKLLILCVSFIIISCKPENDVQTTPINDTFDTATATLLKSGTFVGTGHDVSGTASLYDSANTKFIVLDPFMSQNGPDLRVYYSTDENATAYISLGKLKSITGKQSYKIPDNTDIDQYKFVLIWCQQFTVRFGKAQL